MRAKKLKNVMVLKGVMNKTEQLNGEPAPFLSEEGFQRLVVDAQISQAREQEQNNSAEQREKFDIVRFLAVKLYGIHDFEYQIDETDTNEAKKKKRSPSGFGPFE